MAITKVEFDLSQDTKDFLTSLFGGKQIEADQPAIGFKKALSKKTIKVEEEEEEDSESVVNITQIRETIQQKAEAGKTDAIKTLLKKYDAKSASTLPEENYEAFFKALNKL